MSPCTRPSQGNGFWDDFMTNPPIVAFAAVRYTRVSKADGSQSLGLQRDALGPGAVAWSPPGEPHGVANDTDGSLVLLVAVAPNPNRQGLPRYV